MALIPPIFLDAVVALELMDARGGICGQATGFIYSDLVEENNGRRGYKAYLVTNRHVLENMSRLLIRFNPSGDMDTQRLEYDLFDRNGDALWVADEDPTIDIALFRFNVRELEERGYRFESFRSNQHVANTEEMRRRGTSEGDFVYTLGFPMGLVGIRRDFVIARMGIIARIRDLLAGESNEFLIDSAIFPGNSGGPIIAKPEVISIQGTRTPAAYLIGIVFAYIPFVGENSGLALAHPVDFIQRIIARNPDL